MSSDKEKPASHFHGPRNEEFHKLGMFERVFGDFENTASPYSRFAKNVLGGLFVAPVVWFHENVVEKFRGEEYPYYHRRYRRVPTIDECYFHDHACQYEAEKQLVRDKVVENQLINLLRERAEDCMYYETYTAKEVHDPSTKCGELKRDYEIAAANFYIKYGDIKFPTTAQNVLMKQKHRLIWERRNGPLPTSPNFNLD